MQAHMLSAGSTTGRDFCPQESRSSNSTLKNPKNRGGKFTYLDRAARYAQKGRVGDVRGWSRGGQNLRRPKAVVRPCGFTGADQESQPPTGKGCVASSIWHPPSAESWLEAPGAGWPLDPSRGDSRVPNASSSSALAEREELREWMGH